jgi:hypothetical protein
MDEPRRLTPASVQYNDWRGTAALDNPHRAEKLYELLGVDQDEWSILGLEMWGGRIGEGDLTSGVRVFVAPAESTTADEILKRGEVTVLEVALDDAELVWRLLRDGFKRWAITVTPSYFAERDVRVTVSGHD